jgi:hypothetical protein
MTYEEVAHQMPAEFAARKADKLRYRQVVTVTEWGREFVTGNEKPRIVAHRCIIEASIGKRIVQTIEAPHSPGHRSNHRAAQEAT